MAASVMQDENNESWIAVENGVFHIFTTKSSAIDYRIKNKNKSIKVMHRYSDGTMQELVCWTEPEIDENDVPLMDKIEESPIKGKSAFFAVFDDIFGKDDNLD
jgi:hypothetical protein